MMILTRDVIRLRRLGRHEDYYIKVNAVNFIVFVFSPIFWNLKLLIIKVKGTMHYIIT